MTIYADSSFFVSLYVPDQHFARAHRLAAEHSRIWLTPLHRAEWAHAVAQGVFQRRISASEAQTVRRNFERDRQSGFWTEVDLPEMVFERCVQLSGQYASRIAMRTLDTMHVASALELGAQRFWTFHERQAKLARAVGLKS